MKQQFTLPKISAFKNPTIITLQSGKYAMPGWIPVNDDTELSDIHIDQVESRIKPVNPFKQEFEINGSTGKSGLPNRYKVTISEQYGNSCTCPAFSFHKNCKHIKHVIDNLL